MACAWLQEALGEEPAPLPGIDAARWRAVAALARSDLAPVTTSMGRLFDAIAALCGLRQRVNYEGQAAAELEAACDPTERDCYPLPVAEHDGRLVLDARATVRAVRNDLQAGAATETVAARFHNALAAATTCACVLLAARSDVATVVLGGGSFQNRRLLEAVARGLRHAGLRVLVPERLPPNDGGISYGQAAVAAARLASWSTPLALMRAEAAP
jgi:hydrogenase maturation protein HypF